MDIGILRGSFPQLGKHVAHSTQQKDMPAVHINLLGLECWCHSTTIPGKQFQYFWLLICLPTLPETKPKCESLGLLD